MNIIVTGGAGYIGSHTCRALAAAGHRICVLDDFSTGHRHAIRWGSVFEIDIRDAAAVDAAFRSVRPDAVLHFAALAYVGESMEKPLEYFRTNVGGTLNVVAAAVAAGCHYFVLSSSCATYGIPEALPITEFTAQSPASPYGVSKLMAEQTLGWAATAHPLRWAALRYFNAAGADPESGIGEDHDPETHLIPCAINAALGRAPALRIFGADYDTPDGTAIRDYVHVADLADAHVKALDYLVAGGEPGPFNLGSGRPASVMEIIATVERLGGLPVPHVVAERRPGDPPSLWADATKAQRRLAWVPARSGLEEIVRTAIDWHGSASVARRAGRPPRPHPGGAGHSRAIGTPA